MARKFRIRALAAAIETTYGTDATPTGSTNAIELVDGAIEPLQGDEIEHAYDRGELGNYLSVLVNKRIVITGRVAFAGAGGVADDVPAWGPLLRACGCSETINATTDVRYAPIDTGIESASLYFWRDGVVHKALGARGSFAVEISANQIPYFNFTFTALYVGPVTEAMPSIDLSGFSKPLAVNNANTTCSVHGITCGLTQLNLDASIAVQPLDVPETNEVIITDRLPAGQMTWHAQDLSTKDWFEAVEDSDTGAVAIVHGTPAGAGRIVELNGDTVQLSNLAYADANSILAYQANTRWLPAAAGGGDFEIVTK